MRKLVLLAVAALTLPAAQCTSNPSQQATESGYSFAQPLTAPTVARTAFNGQLIVIEHPSMADLQRAAEQRGVKFEVPTDVEESGKFEAGWAAVQPGKFCEVHVLSPAVKPQEVWLGHELLHCSYGQWHLD